MEGGGLFLLFMGDLLYISFIIPFIQMKSESLDHPHVPTRGQMYSHPPLHTLHLANTGTELLFGSLGTNIPQGNIPQTEPK